MASSNRFPGSCARCGDRVEAGAGACLRVDGKFAVLCADHAPRASEPERPVIRVDLEGEQVTLRPNSFLGGDVFARFRDAVAGTAKYDGQRRMSLAPISEVGSLSERLLQAGFCVNASPEVVARVARRDQEDGDALRSAGDRARKVDEDLRARGQHLFAFQREGIDWLAPRAGAILADEMGLGKTIQALVAAPADAGVLVICPKVAKTVWQREAARWRPDLRVSLLSGRGSFRWPDAGELVVTNYDVLPDADADVELRAIVDRCPTGVTLVADEAHVLKSGGGRNGSKRARAFSTLSDVVRWRGGRAWVVTGSPLLNQPPELWNLLRMVGQTGEVFGTYDQFLRLCGGERGKYGTTWSGEVDSSVPERLRRAMLRRLKSDVLTQLPAKMVDVVDVALDEKAGDRAQKIMDKLAQQGVDASQAVDALRGQARASKVTFTQISKLRELLATAKLACAVEMVEDLETAGEPVVVMSAHRQPVDALAQREGWAAITGDTSDEDRGEIARRFQAGELRGVAGTLQAMGVAITLTRAKHAIILDPLWVPDLNRQAEDRIHRIGQTEAVQVRYLRVDHPLDVRVFDVCEVKRALVARSVDQAAVQVGEASSRRDQASLLRAALAPASDLDAATRGAEELARAIAEIRAARRGKEEGEREASARTRAARKATDVIQSRGYAISEQELTTPARPARDEREAWAREAICQLADACDCARNRDGEGFNKPDSYVGKALAASVPLGLTDGEWRLAIEICWRYPGQVGRPRQSGEETTQARGDDPGARMTNEARRRAGDHEPA